ncbi:MAG: hypothetical protein MK102_00085 [Fuerstiella sp.]|nr:hypothetical protein [Fuerstiella sp.]
MFAEVRLLAVANLIVSWFECVLHGRLTTLCAGLTTLFTAQPRYVLRHVQYSAELF